jgi:hypothetical protein
MTKRENTEEPKHFNAGNVWGKILKAEEKKTRDKKTPFLELEIDCGSSQYGNVRAYGRLWGKEKITALVTHHGQHKGASYRLKGFYNQYSDNEVRYSGYSFYDFEAVAPDTHPVPRASFILVGQVMKKEMIDGEGIVTLIVSRPQKDQKIDEELTLYFFDLDPFFEIESEDIIEVRGLLRKREAEDIYGGSTNDKFRPYIMQTTKRKKACS